MASPQSSVASPVRPASIHHLHPAGDVCPLCDQPIPHDRADEIAGRLEARDREQATAISEQLEARFENQKTELLVQADLKAAQKVAAARDEARIAAQAEAKTQIEEADQARHAALAALQSTTEAAETARVSAEAARVALLDQLDEVKSDSEAALAKLQADVNANEAVIRADAVRVANEAAAARIVEAEAQKAAAEDAGAALQAKLEEAQRNGEAALAQAKTDAAANEVVVRAEVAAATEAAALARINGAEQAKAEADAKATVAEALARTLQETHATELADRLKEQREALEAATTDAVNAEKAATFEEKLKLSAKVEALQRTIDKKTAEELGEGAEIDLYEALKAEFEDDRIERVARGVAGADIIHTVVHNGRECGKIIYDSKNHNAWRNDFVTKLKSDQMAAKAEHAILSTRKFPSGERHLHVQDGVVIASPARVVALAIIIRDHLVQTHSLRMSNEARTRKTAELYAFITSARCNDLLSRFDTHAEDLMDLQVKEKKAHDATWRRQGELVRSIQKVRAELRNEIDSIIGLASPPETAP